MKQHVQSSDMSYNSGIYVNTLSMDIASKTYEGAVSHCIRLEACNFTSKGTLWCHLVGDNFVICKGTVIGSCPKHHAPEDGRNMKIGRLPTHMRPREALQFAALSRVAYDVGGHVAFTSNLVTLLVTEDGWILGTSSNELEGAIDLSAIRFAIKGGIALVDGVRLYTVDVGPTRMVTMQGALSPMRHVLHRTKPLALLPESCRPPQDMPFVVCGSFTASFHLVIARPSYGVGVGGEIQWWDSIWNRDKVHMSGLMWEVSRDAMPYSTLKTTWTGEALAVFVQDFQRHLIRKFGSIEDAWAQAFDTDGNGSVDFTEFGLGCKASGYVGNTTRLWAALDEDGGGDISLEEFMAGAPPTQATAEVPAFE